MAALNKIAANSPSRQSPSELETSLANALYDLETNTQDLRGSLRPLQFVSAREVRDFLWLFAPLCQLFDWNDEGGCEEKEDGVAISDGNSLCVVGFQHEKTRGMGRACSFPPSWLRLFGIVLVF
jgi:ribosomal S7e-like protein